MSWIDAVFHLPGPSNGGRPADMSAQDMQHYINLTDEQFECQHGALPLDTNRPVECHCWTPEKVAALKHRVLESPDFSEDD